MDTLKVILMQTDIIAGDPSVNLARFERLLHPGEAQLVVLPEVFTTGFHPGARDCAETMGGRTCDWLLAQAERLRAVVTGSVVMQREDGSYVNRLLWATPVGELDYYDKHHLFRMAGEHQRYAAGERRRVFQIKGWRVLPQVCYDLRFPVWCRNREDYDLALFVANWPAARQDHWRTLLKARAIENLSYTLGVNRIGRDAQGQDYAGGSVVFGPRGELLVDAAMEAGGFAASLDGEALRAYRAAFPAHLDADKFYLSESP